MCETSRSSSRYAPEVGRSRQPRMCIRVDLPEPEGPVTARNSPSWTSSDTPRNARTSTSPTVYVLTRLRTEMTGGIVYRESDYPVIWSSVIDWRIDHQQPDDEMTSYPNSSFTRSAGHRWDRGVP